MLVVSRRCLSAFAAMIKRVQQLLRQAACRQFPTSSPRPPAPLHYAPLFLPPRPRLPLVSLKTHTVSMHACSCSKSHALYRPLLQHADMLANFDPAPLPTSPTPSTPTEQPPPPAGLTCPSSTSRASPCIDATMKIRRRRLGTPNPARYTGTGTAQDIDSRKQTREQEQGVGPEILGFFSLPCLFFGPPPSVHPALSFISLYRLIVHISAAVQGTLKRFGERCRERERKMAASEEGS